MYSHWLNLMTVILTSNLLKADEVVEVEKDFEKVFNQRKYYNWFYLLILIFLI